MTCKGVRSQLSSYLDGELTGFEMLQMRSHIHACNNCLNEVDETRKLKWLMSNLPDADPGEEFAARLKQRVFTAPSVSNTRRLPLAMASGLAFGLVLLTMFFAVNGRVKNESVAGDYQIASSNSHFDIARDQAYQASGDPFADSCMVMPVSSSAPHAPR